MRHNCDTLRRVIRLDSCAECRNQLPCLVLQVRSYHHPKNFHQAIPTTDQMVIVAKET